MSDLLDQLITPEVRMVLYLMVATVVMLYVLSIVYVIRDAQRRGAEPWWLWALISVIPIVGLLAYVILRPSSYLVDREEQDLDIALREHQLSHYGICPKCGAPIDRDFVVCPVCNTQVRNVCPTCHRPLSRPFSRPVSGAQRMHRVACLSGTVYVRVHPCHVARHCLA